MVDIKSVWVLSGVSFMLLTTPATAVPSTDAADPSPPAVSEVTLSIAPVPTDSTAASSPETSPPETLPDSATEAVGLSPTPPPEPVADASDTSSAPAAPPSVATSDHIPEPEAAIAPPPRLHGEPEPPLPATTMADPMEQMSLAEWDQLVNEADDSEQAIEADLENSASQDLTREDLSHEEATASELASELASEDLPDPEDSTREDGADENSVSQTLDSAAIAPVPVQLSDEEIMISADWLEDALGQVTSVSQLSDVQPDDWAFQALQSLIEQYGVISGYPDSTFRGDRPLTRYEFAVVLNPILDSINNQLVVIEPTNRQDLEILQRLSDDFRTELTSIRGRVDGLEARTAALEAQQFSTTALLNGQVVLGLAAAGGGDPPGTGTGNLVLTHLTQLQLSASFSGRDVLRVGLVSGNFDDRGFASPSSLNTNMALLAYQTDTNNQIELDSLEYRFAAGDRLVFTIKPAGFSLSTVLSPNSLFASSSEGAISRFAGYSPVFKIGSLDAGVGLDFLVSNRLRLQVAYGAREANEGTNGLLSADHRALGVQLLFRPSGSFTTGIAYVNAFSEDGQLDTFTGSNNADISGGFNEPAAIHALNGTLQWALTPGIVFGTWGGIIVSDSLPSNAATLSTTYMFSLGFPDPLGREGDLFGLMVGQPPRLRYGFLIEREDQGSSMHYEAFYRFRVNDHLSITPGCFIVTNPGHIDENNDIFVASLRTTFSF